MKNVVFLTDDFFSRCDERGYLEIEHKSERPYFVLVAVIDGVTWGLPFRSSIRHPYAYWTDRENRCGIDYSKAVVIEGPEDIDTSRTPHLRDNEFAMVNDHGREIEAGFKRYAKQYKKALRSGHPRYANMLKFSTLQNYKAELGL